MMQRRLLPLALVALGTWFVYGCGAGMGGDTGAGGDTGSGGSGGSTSGGGSSGNGGHGWRLSHRRHDGRGGTRRHGTGLAGRGGTTGTAGTTGAGGATSTGVPNCVWPTAASTVMLSATQTITGTYDGGMRRFVGTGPLGASGQNEDQGPLFKSANGGDAEERDPGQSRPPTASTARAPARCKNVWWEDVGEDAATLQGTRPARR